jgi:hypothetical protein
MEVTKEEVEKLLGYEITNFKVTKKAYRGKKVSKMTLAIQPKRESEFITITIKPKS